jgi:hypothetical protein
MTWEQALLYQSTQVARQRQQHVSINADFHLQE